MLDAISTIALPDATILHILHAHTRANIISNFSLSAKFTMYTSLESYFSLYWCQCVNKVVGHPFGQLDRILYLNYFGLPYNARNEHKTCSLKLWYTLEPYSVTTYPTLKRHISIHHSTTIGPQPILISHTTALNVIASSHILVSVICAIIT